MPEVKRLKEMNDQMKRELGVEREKVSVSAARYNTVVYRYTCCIIHVNLCVVISSYHKFILS